MDNVYLPVYDTNNCAYIQSSDVIRVYDTRPTNNSTVGYRDYFINSNYIYNVGSQSFGSYSTIPQCISQDRITTDVFYRNDIADIMIIFIIFAFISFWCPWKIIIRMFRRWS